MEKEILEILKSIQEGQIRLESKVDRIEKKLDGVAEQVEGLRKDLFQVELVTSNNWNEITKLKLKELMKKEH